MLITAKIFVMIDILPVIPVYKYYTNSPSFPAAGFESGMFRLQLKAEDKYLIVSLEYLLTEGKTKAEKVFTIHYERNP